MARKEKTEDGPAKRSRGWIVVLILFVVLGGGGFGTIAVTNLIATSGYATNGDSMGTLVIPRFSDGAVPIMEGTDLGALRHGVGWYEFTSEPGDYGNCAIAGHRLGWGQPFARLAMLQIGDEIIVTIDSTTFTYTVITPATVIAGTDAEVLAGVPYDPERRPTRALLTLTTAASVLPSPNRLVVIAELGR